MVGRRRRPALEPARLLRGRGGAALGAPRARDGLVRHRAAPPRRRRATAPGPRPRSTTVVEPPVRRTRPAVARHLRAVPRVGRRPPTAPIEWIDYDPNWRQFLGTALAVAVTDFDLSPPLAARAREAVHLAVDAEPPDRVPPTYANIALLRAWLDAWAGRADDGYAARRRRHVPAPRLLQRVRLTHLLRHRPAGARALAASRRPGRAAARRRAARGGAVDRHRPLVARRARQPLRPVHPGLRHGPRLLRQRPRRSRCGAPDLPAPLPSLRRPTSCPTATTCAWRRCSSTSACGCRPTRSARLRALPRRPRRSRQVIEDVAPPGGHRLARGRPGRSAARRATRGSTPGASSTRPRCTGASPTARSAGCGSSTTARPGPGPSERRLVVECDVHPPAGPDRSAGSPTPRPPRSAPTAGGCPGLDRRRRPPTPLARRSRTRPTSTDHVERSPASTSDLTPDA